MSSVNDPRDHGTSDASSASVSADARTLMIAAAERIVAERGLGAMSLRVVQQESGQKNKSAAQYHFGSRDGLVEAVITTRMAQVNGRRREMLDAASGDLRSLVVALVRPAAELTVLRSESYWARFLLQAGNDPAVEQIVRRNVQGEAYHDLLRRVGELMGAVPVELRRVRIDRALGLVFASLAAGEAARDAGSPRTIDTDSAIEDLVDCTMALLTSPASPQTLAALSESPDRSGKEDPT